MALIADIFFWVLIGGAGISFIIMLIGYKNDEAHTFHFGFRGGLIFGALALNCSIIKYFV